MNILCSPLEWTHLIIYSKDYIEEFSHMHNSSRRFQFSLIPIIPRISSIDFCLRNNNRAWAESLEKIHFGSLFCKWVNDRFDLWRDKKRWLRIWESVKYISVNFLCCFESRHRRKKVFSDKEQTPQIVCWRINNICLHGNLLFRVISPLMLQSWAEWQNCIFILKVTSVISCRVQMLWTNLIFNIYCSHMACYIETSSLSLSLRMYSLFMSLCRS